MEKQIERVRVRKANDILNALQSMKKNSSLIINGCEITRRKVNIWVYCNKDYKLFDMTDLIEKNLSNLNKFRLGFCTC